MRRNSSHHRFRGVRRGSDPAGSGRPAAVGFDLRAQHGAGPAVRAADLFPAQGRVRAAKAGTEITPSMIPSVSQYAGQQLLTGQQAEAYADHFIAVHVAKCPGQDLLPAVRRSDSPAEQCQAGRHGRHRVQGRDAAHHAAERLRLVEGLPDHLHRRDHAFALGGLTLAGSAVRAGPRAAGPRSPTRPSPAPLRPRPHDPNGQPTRITRTRQPCPPASARHRAGRRTVAFHE